MTKDEELRYEHLKDKLFGNSELLEFLNLHIKGKHYELCNKTAEGEDIQNISAMIAGVAELEIILGDENIGSSEEVERIESTI